MIPILLLHAMMIWQQENVGANSQGAKTIKKETVRCNPQNGCMFIVGSLSDDQCYVWDGQKWQSSGLLQERDRCYMQSHAVPFDVPPKQVKEIASSWNITFDHAAAGKALAECNSELLECSQEGYVIYGRKMKRVCTNKSRFLLMSEDGKWHCLALGQKP